MTMRTRVSLLQLLACGAGAAVVVSSAALGGESWVTYRNPKIGLELGHPPSWKTEEAPNDYVSFSSSAPATVFTFGRYPERPQYTDFKKWVGDPYSKPNGVSKVIEKRYIKAGTLPAYLLIVERGFGPPTIELQAWFAVPYAGGKKGGVVYALTGQVPKRDPKAQETRDVFEEMARSVKMSPVAE
jgi:hypothetical protein